MAALLVVACDAQAPPCVSVLATERLANSTAYECHINPSTSEYIELDTRTGKRLRDLYGYDFKRSPDGKRVAHVGGYPHFAPPFAKSNYLQFDETSVYPTDREVRNEGKKWFEIHDFRHDLTWSPDSRHVALTDCLYDWTSTADANDNLGEESNRHCVVAIVALNGSTRTIPLAGTAEIALKWLGAHRLSVSSRVVTVP